MIQIKRAYEAPDDSDGRRILVDRLWPRGVSKERAQIDEWAKDLAPSAELREYFCHDVAKWTEFQKRYKAELKKNTEALDRIVDQAKKGTVTLIYGAKDEEHNQAAVLRDVIAERFKD